MTLGNENNIKTFVKKNYQNFTICNVHTHKIINEISMFW